MKKLCQNPNEVLLKQEPNGSALFIVKLASTQNLSG